MSSLDEALCPGDGSFLMETVDDGPLDDEAWWRGGPYFACPTCHRSYDMDDSRVEWRAITHGSEL